MPVPEDGNYNKPPYINNLYVVLYDNDEDTEFPNHWHSAMEIIMPVKDTYEVNLHEKTYLLREGDIMLIPPLDYHSISIPKKSKKGQRIIILFEPVIFSNFHELSVYIHKFRCLNLITPEEMPDIHESAKNIILKCRDEHHKNDIYKNIVIYTKIIEFFILLLRHHTIKDFNKLYSEQYGKRQDFIVKLDKVLEYVNKNISNVITLDAAADVANLSKYHFERLFKAYMNMTFTSYIKLKRINYSEKMLMDPGMAIMDVALNSGFNSISAFNRVFREIKKCTPSEFKKQCYRSRDIPWNDE